MGDRYTVQGAYVMGRNLDYPVFTEPLAEFQTLFLIEPHQGQRLASLAWPGYVGVCTGINASGVALAQLSAMSRDRTLKGTPAALRFRVALEDGDTVAAVMALGLARWGDADAASAEAGLYDLPGSVLHVSPGTGTTFVPFRFLARPEVTELVLRSAPRRVQQSS